VAVVTITRQYGAGGSEVARLVAERLRWTVIDNEFVVEVARRAGLPPEEVAAREERGPSLMQRLARALATGSPEVFVPDAPAGGEPAEEAIVRQAERVIAEAAAHGRMVLVGRGAQAYLSSARQEDALHVYVVAPRAARIRTLVERLGLDAARVEQTMDATDADRDRYVNQHYGRRRQDPANYHLVLNTSWLGYHGAAELVVEAVRRRGWG
jgi:cytidylate kinase